MIGGAVLLFAVAMLGIYYVRSVQKHELRAEKQQARIDAHPVKASVPTLWHEPQAEAATRYANHTIDVTGRLEVSTPLNGQQMMLLRTGDGDRTMRAMVAAGRTPPPGTQVRLFCNTLSYGDGEPSLADCTLVG